MTDLVCTTTGERTGYDWRSSWPSLNCPSLPEGATFCGNEVTNYVGDVLSILLKQAEDLKDDALCAIRDLQLTVGDAAKAINGAADYNPDTSGVPVTHTPPPTLTPDEPDYSDTVPDAPEMPDPNERLLKACEIDSIFTRAQTDIAKVNRKAKRDALYQAGALGIGLADPTLLTRLRDANQENNARSVQAAVEKAVQEGNWRREDYKDAYALQAQIYQASTQGASSYLNAETQRYAARIDEVRMQIQNEAERRGWSEMQLKDILEQADKSAFYPLEKAKALADVLTTIDQAVANLLAGLAQGIYSAANVGLSGGSSYGMSLGESTNYNYSGEIAT